MIVLITIDSAFYSLSTLLSTIFFFTFPGMKLNVLKREPPLCVRIYRGCLCKGIYISRVRLISMLSSPAGIFEWNHPLVVPLFQFPETLFDWLILLGTTHVYTHKRRGDKHHELMVLLCFNLFLILFRRILHNVCCSQNFSLRFLPEYNVKRNRKA